MDSQILIVFEKMRKGAIIGLYTGAQAVEQLYDMEIAKEVREIQSK
jgi:hypothetical protein